MISRKSLLFWQMMFFVMTGLMLWNLQISVTFKSQFDQIERDYTALSKSCDERMEKAVQRTNELWSDELDEYEHAYAETWEHALIDLREKLKTCHCGMRI